MVWKWELGIRVRCVDDGLGIGLFMLVVCNIWVVGLLWGYD